MSTISKRKMPTKSAKRPRDYKTSDPESSTPIPDFFKRVINQTREDGSWVLFQYDDGVYYLLPPSEITLEIVKPLRREINAFKDKERLERGMRVRLFYTTMYPVSKATVIEVSKDYDRINSLFDTLDKTAKERKKREKKQNKKPVSGSRMTHVNRTEDNRAKRKRLNSEKLGKEDTTKTQVLLSDDSDEQAESSDDDDAPGPISFQRRRLSSRLPTEEQEPRKRSSLTPTKEDDLDDQFPAIMAPPEKSVADPTTSDGEVEEGMERIDDADFSGDDYDPMKDRGQKTKFMDSEDDDSCGSTETTGDKANILDEDKNDESTPHYTTEQIEEYVRKRDELQKEVEMYNRILKSAGHSKPSRKPKIKVPAIKWSFNADPTTVDRTIFQRLQPKSPIWVRQARLQEAQKKAKDMDTYAQKLMWKVLIPDDQLIALSKAKMKGVGFAKLFGHENFTAFYDHVLKYKKSKEGPSGAKWNNQITTEVELRKRFISTFDRKISRVVAHTASTET